uniref:Uncharacterized protein n=1 Tax=Glossina brevipalpis TaxID=37001 RepID=A0A1A9VZN4_9MUSC
MEKSGYHSISRDAFHSCRGYKESREVVGEENFRLGSSCRSREPTTPPGKFASFVTNIKWAHQINESELMAPMSLQTKEQRTVQFGTGAFFNHHHWKKVFLLNQFLVLGPTYLALAPSSVQGDYERCSRKKFVKINPVLFCCYAIIMVSKLQLLFYRLS